MTTGDHPYGNVYPDGSQSRLPLGTVFLSDEKLSSPTAISQWHFKWHHGLVRMVGRGTSSDWTEGLALTKDGDRLTGRFCDGHHQHYWSIIYKGPHIHGTNRFQIAFACNFAAAHNGTCEGEGNEIVVSDPNGFILAPSRYDSPKASWWEIGDW